MQNEFEKQVQRKLEELKLFPSGPVWQKLEVQLRKKKDRRRLLIWLPLSVLLLGGGVWIATSYAPGQGSYSKAADARQESTYPVLTQKTPGASIKTIVNEHQTGKHNRRDNKASATTSTQIQASEPLSTSSLPKLKGTQKKSPVANAAKEKRRDKSDAAALTDKKNPDRLSAQPGEKIISSDSPSVLASDTIANTSMGKEKNDDTSKVINIAKMDSIRQDPGLMKKPPVKKQNASKWKFSVVMNTGVSGLGRLNVFNGMKADSVYGYANSSGGGSGQGGPVIVPNNSSGSSSVKKGWAFSIAMAAKKELSKLTSFSAGLQYNYYSNIIEVGNKVSQTTVIRDFFVSQYYSNNTTTHPYTNHYHFISLPLVMDWRLSTKSPLNFHAGLSMQYLIRTNGLVFDYTRQAYFYSKKTFNNMQLLSGLGFGYSFPIRDHSFAIGPELQYGLTRLEKKNPDHHLFSYGLKAEFQLDKKSSPQATVIE